jgi:probable HAF family extracellular repeat protein
MPSVKFLALVLGVLALSAGAAQAARITVRDLGTLPGDVYSHGTAINAGGQVVGYSQSGPVGERAFQWQAGVMTELPGLADSRTIATDINDGGLVVGYSVVAGLEHAVAWQNGVLRNLGTLPGDSGSAALGVNNARQIVGYSVGARVRAVVWQPDGTQPVDLGAIPGDSTYAAAINDAGWIGGYSYTGGQFADAFEWSPGSMVTLLKPAGNCCAYVSSLNNLSEAVGSTRTASSNDQPVEWLADGSLRFLPKLRGGTTGFAASVTTPA